MSWNKYLGRSKRNSAVSGGSERRDVSRGSFSILLRPRFTWHGVTPAPLSGDHSTSQNGDSSNPRASFFASTTHDASKNKCTSTKELRIDFLGTSKHNAVLEWRSRRDAYTGEAIIDTSMEGMELDHVVELHVVRDAIDAIPKQGIQFERRKRLLIDFTKNSVVNEEFNLNFTTKKINVVKNKAFLAFQEDYRQGTGKQVEEGLLPYLADVYSIHHESRRVSGRFSRPTSYRIQQEVKLSFDEMMTRFELDRPLHGYMMETLTDIESAMKL